MANSTIENLLAADNALFKNEMGRSVTYYPEYPDEGIALAESVTAILDKEEDAGQATGLDRDYQDSIADRAIIYITREDLSVTPQYMDAILDDEGDTWDVLKPEKEGSFWKLYCSKNERSFY